MGELDEIREQCKQLAARLQGQTQGPEVRAVYLDMATLVGQLQGALGDARRTHSDSEALKEAVIAFDQLRATVRQVGLDIRLSTDVALAMGLQSAVQCAFDTLDSLQQINAEEA